MGKTKSKKRIYLNGAKIGTYETKQEAGTGNINFSGFVPVPGNKKLYEARSFSDWGEWKDNGYSLSKEKLIECIIDWGYSYSEFHEDFRKKVGFEEYYLDIVEHDLL